MPDPVTVSREDHLAIVSLSHPDRLNVLDRQGWEALANAMTALGEDPRSIPMETGWWSRRTSVRLDPRKARLQNSSDY